MLDDPTVELAMKELERAEAADADPNAQPAAPAPAESAPEGDRTAQPAKEESDSPETPPPGTPATEEPAKPATEQPAADNKAATKFAKNQARLQGTWKEVNERKAEIEKRLVEANEKFAEITKREAALKAAEAKANQPKYKPEDYENASVQWLKEAESLEAAGKFDEADAKRVQARQAVEYAKQIRANPPAAPVTDAQAEANFKAQQKEWWSKAAIDFPAVVKKDSAEAQSLAALVKSEPAVINDPKGMYYAARLVCAETSAARVPAMEKETGELRAKVKELNEKLAISGDGAVTIQHGQKAFNEKTEAEQEAELRREAEVMPRF